MEIQGTITKIGETEIVGTKGFKKRLLVIKTNEQYPQHIPVDFNQDKTTLLDFYKLGDIVEVGINIRGSEWQGKFYCNLAGWKISKTDAEKSSKTFMPDRERPVPKMNGDMANQFNEAQEFNDDLPF